MKRFIKSFYYAIAGIQYHLKSGLNIKIQVLLGIIAITLGIILSIDPLEWVLLTIIISGVLALETLNSSIELLCDVVTLDHHEGIKKIKDLAAGAVLLFSFGALIGGILIFLPKIWAFIP